VKLICGLLLCLVMAGTSVAQPKLDPNLTALTVSPLPAGSTPRPVALTRLAAQLRDEQTIGTYWTGVVCLSSFTLDWKQFRSSLPNLKEVFAEELQTSGFTPSAKPGSLFGDVSDSSTDLEIGAVIKGVDASYCNNVLNTSGKVTLDVEWQVYSNLKRETVATIETHEAAQDKALKSGAKRSLGQQAFAANVRALLSDTNFRQVVLGPDSPAKSATGPAAPIKIVGVGKGPTKIPDATGSVVAIFSGDAFGSGVLISSDGLLLTNHHVVGSAKTVKVRWSDGFETVGEVLRSDKRRDVALVKTETHGRQPLALDRTVPTPGTTVFAIGSPLDPALQSTVTRGVVSARRVVDGFSFIQADVPVTHGNSGGPLLTEAGVVVGLTDWGVPAEAGSTSLNFFIPIGDALDFLSLKPGT
jgi:S1-C subfamily serine protease